MTFLLNRALSEALFEGFFIQRWNDRIRPINLVEADKNSSKMIITLYLGKKLEDSGREVKWIDIVDRGIYDALIRYAVSDISSVVHAKLRKNKSVYVTSIIKIVNKQYDKHLPTSFMDSFRKYIVDEKSDILSQEDNIIRLAHRLSLKLEYRIVSSLGYGSFFLPHEEEGQSIDDEINILAKSLDLGAILDESGAILSKELDLILKLTDRLRYQVRWSQTPRVPQTSVLGHSFYVAACVYFAVRHSHDQQRVVNNFYAGLMHDFLESLTRDIISPVKNSSTEFKNQIDEIEAEMLDVNLLPHLEGRFKKYMAILLRKEFDNRAFDETGQIQFDTASDHSKFDGQLVQAADYYAALLEAYQSINLGISSHRLVGATSRLYSTFKSMEGKFQDKELYSNFLELYDSFITR